MTADSLSDSQKALIDIYRDEYQALMARIGERTAQQNTLWAVLVAFVALAGDVVPKEEHFPRTALLWGTVFVSQMATLFWFSWETEIRRTIIRIHKMKQSIAEQIGGGPFWQDVTYGPALMKGTNWLRAALPMLIPFVALGLAARHAIGPPCSHWGDTIGLAINLALLYFVYTAWREMNNIGQEVVKETQQP